MSGDVSQIINLAAKGNGTIRKYFMMKAVCISIFINIFQGINDVWQEVLMFKLMLNLPINIVELLKNK